MYNCKVLRIVFLLVLSEYTGASKNDTSVIIIGAGAAGLSAAKKLLDNGIKNVKILEAESRIGGRINSVFFGDNWVDLGATYCHGEKGNIVYSTVKDLNLLAPTDSNVKYIHSSGEDIDQKFGLEIFETMIKVYEHERSATNISYGEFFEQRYNKTINEKYRTDEKKLKTGREVLTSFELLVLSNEATKTLYDSPVINDFVENEGDQALNWKGKGYKTFLDVYLGKYPDNTKISEVEKNVMLNKEVTKIDWNKAKKSNGVTIQTSDGSKMSADHVIVTPSLGVLKHDAGNLFQPNLPLEKREAIENIGFGLIMTVVVHYPTKWWDTGFEGFITVWDQEEMEKVYLDFPGEPRYGNRSWITYTSGVFKAEENPNVFVCWFSGVLVPEIELLSDEALANGVTYITKKFLGNTYNVTKPDKIIRSSWNKNPHFRGTYSFQTPAAVRGNNTTNAEEDLAEPIKNDWDRPFVHFAGEATHPTLFGPVQGAVESGIREADRILDYYKNNE